MKTVKTLLAISILAFFTACASTIKFPVSNTVPAADIVTVKKQDKNNNYEIVVTANNLATAGRLKPARKHYTVWIVNESGSTINIGSLIVSNAKKASLKTTTPHNAKTIFITAEDQVNLACPAGVEISRTTFK